MLDQTGLHTKTIQMLQEVFQKYPKINSVILYGSRAKGNFKNGSDIDLTIIAPEMNLTERFKIENEIDDLLLPYKIDLSLYHQIKSLELLDHIKRIGKIFFQR